MGKRHLYERRKLTGRQVSKYKGKERRYNEKEQEKIYQKGAGCPAVLLYASPVWCCDNGSGRGRGGVL